MATATPNVNFECPVCHDEYDQPKFLPCMHVICRKCIVSWLSAAGQGGCPLCRAPILPTNQPKPADLSAAVDTLPTDLATKALIESHHALSDDKVCSVCDNVNATSYCLQCSVKLCKSCSNAHGRFPAFREHVLEDLTSLTPQRLSSTHSTPCDLHADKIGDLYCLDHKKVICLVCSSTQHRACSGVATVGAVAVDARDEFEQQAHRLRNQEADLDKKIKRLIQDMRDALAHFTSCHSGVKDTFHDLRQQLDKREKEIAAQLQQHQDDVMSKMQAEKSALEQQKASIAAHAGSLERLKVPSPDSALLGMLEKLKARLDDLEKQKSTPSSAGNMALKCVVFDKDVVTRFLCEIDALGQVTSPVTPVQPVKKDPQQVAQSPQLVKQAPQPVKQAPQPMTQAPQPLKLAPQPMAQTPQLVKQAPHTVKQAPQPVKQAPQPVTQSPQPVKQAPQPVKQAPQAVKKDIQGGGGKPTGAALAKVLKLGDRVRRGPGWGTWSGNVDGGGGLGTVTAVPSRILKSLGPTDLSAGYVDVRWDTKHSTFHSMGVDGVYELELA